MTCQIVNKLADLLTNQRKSLITKLLNANEQLQVHQHICDKSQSSLNELQSIKQLNANQFQTGCYLNVTITEKLIQDKHACITVLRHFNTSFILVLLHSACYLDQIQCHDLLCLKEPYHKKLQMFGQSVSVLLLDNIYHNVVLIKHDHFVLHQDCNELKQKGNKHFAAKRYLLAIHCYSAALDELQSQSVSNDETENVKFKLLCNRSLCFAHIEHYSNALEDAQNALKMNSKSIKATFRCIMALNGIGKYLNALQHLKSITKTKQAEPKLASLEKELLIKYRESMGILQNEKNEKVEFHLYAAFADPHQWQEMSNMIGSVEIRYVDQKKGRGLFASKPIKAGQTICFEKVFAKSTSAPSKYKMAKKEALCMEILRKIYPYLKLQSMDGVRCKYDSCLLYAQRVGSLYDSSSIKKTVPPLQLFRYQQTISFSNADDGGDDEKENAVGRTEHILSVQNIEGIIDSNCYESLIDPDDIEVIEAKYANTSKYDEKEIESKMYLGIWPLASFINHSDTPNAYRIFWYNHMIVIADTNIGKGEEICLSYLNPFMSETEKKEHLLQGWNIQ